MHAMYVIYPRMYAYVYVDQNTYVLHIHMSADITTRMSLRKNAISELVYIHTLKCEYTDKHVTRLSIQIRITVRISRFEGSISRPTRISLMTPVSLCPEARIAAVYVCMYVCTYVRMYVCVTSCAIPSSSHNRVGTAMHVSHKSTVPSLCKPRTVAVCMHEPRNCSFCVGTFVSPSSASLVNSGCLSVCLPCLHGAS